MASGFVTESEIAERKAVRQSEWEKVRKPSEPELAPEAPIGTTLDILAENKAKKDAAWEEEHSFQNNLFNRGLEEDEAKFLDQVDDARVEAERQKMLQERKELEEFEKQQEEVFEQEYERKLELERKTVPLKRKTNTDSAKNLQRSILAGAVKRKSQPQDKDESKKTKSDSVNTPVVEKPAAGLLGLADYGSDSEESDS